MSKKEKARIESQGRKERYKELLDQGGSIADNAETADVISTLKSIQGLMSSSDAITSKVELSERVDNCSEVVMDAQVVKISHEILGSAMQCVSGSEFNDDQFINCVKRLIQQGTNSSWDKLNELVLPMWKTFSWSQCLLGTFDPEAAAPVATQKERQPRARIQLTQQMQPETVGKLQQDEKRAQILNVVMKQMMQMFKDNGNQAIPFYEVVIDPHNFMNTVDNCFQIAFLFRDGHLFLDMDDEGLPLVLPVTKKDKDSNQYQQTQQLICTVNPRLCSEMIKKYGITEPLLEINRDELQQSTQSVTQNPVAGSSTQH